MSTFVEIATNLPHARGPYHYHLPPELEGQVSPGCLVVVPFGNQVTQGVVLRFVNRPQVAETRPIQELVDSRPAFTPAQLALASWLAENTLAPIGACLDAMIPPGLSQHSDVLVSLNRPALEAAGGLAKITQPMQNRLLALLERRGNLRGRQIDAALPHQEWRKTMQALARSGLVRTQSVLPPPAVRPKLVRTAQLSCPPAEIEAHASGPGLAELGRGEVGLRRLSILRFLAQEPWPVELPWVYAHTGGNAGDLEKLAELELVSLREEETWRDPVANISPVMTSPPLLTADQNRVLDSVLVGLAAAGRGEPVRPFLLHGVTSSGKTEIYLQAVAEVLRQGKQAIVLVPEIALTPQTIRRFLGRFPGQVGVVHSRLSPGERYDTWRRARAGEIPLIIGARSALFTPLPRLALIVVDECHDESYYQAENPPCYHAATAAAAYAGLAGAVCLLGTATPDVTQAYLAEQGRWQQLSLPLRLLAHRQVLEQQSASLSIELPPLTGEGETASLALPPVKIVDMRKELKGGNRSIFSHDLQAELGRVLEAGQQAILFLNRRGTATYVFCRDCGKSLHCPRCDRPLTFHAVQAGSSRVVPAQASLPAQARSALTCHTCGYRRQMPVKCPACGSTQIRQFGTGTEKVEAEVHAMFPQAGTLRWDAETTREKDAHDIILAHFAAHRADILIGTQMLAKGLDLPLVTLVGVILAETALNLPDYRSGERTFQLLTQVAGRAGRSPLGGSVILQTFDPENYAIQAASGHDFAAFYTQEMIFRRQLGYPPFARLVRLETRHAQDAAAQSAAEELARSVRRIIEGEERKATDLIGPAPCFFGKANGLFRWQLILRGPDPAGVVRSLPPASLVDWRVEVDPPSLL